MTARARSKVRRGSSAFMKRLDWKAAFATSCILGILLCTSLIGCSNAIDNAPVENTLTTAPPRLQILDLDFSWGNLWGYGENVYLGLNVSGFSDSTPMLIRTSVQGELETLLTYGEVKALVPNPTNVSMLVAVLECPDGTLFTTTHPYVSILRKKPGKNWENVLNTKHATAYGMAVNPFGDIFFTARHPEGFREQVVEGAIYRSQDNGDTWSKVYSEAIDMIYGIACCQTSVNAGARNAILHSRDRGDTWQKYTLPGSWRTVLNLNWGKWIASSSSRDPLVAISFDSGSSWEILANRPKTEICPGANNISYCNGLLVGGTEYALGIVYSQDEGATWQACEIYQGVATQSVYLMPHLCFMTGDLIEGPFFQKSGSGKLVILDLEDIPPAPPQSFSVLSLDSLAPGATSALADCLLLMLNGERFTITAECIYPDVASMANMKVDIYPAYAPWGYDTVPISSFELPFVQNSTQRKTVELDPKVRFLKVRVTNQDATNILLDVKVMATLGG